MKLGDFIRIDFNGDGKMTFVKEAEGRWFPFCWSVTIPRRALTWPPPARVRDRLERVGAN